MRGSTSLPLLASILLTSCGGSEPPLASPPPPPTVVAPPAASLSSEPAPAASTPDAPASSAPATASASPSASSAPAASVPSHKDMLLALVDAFNAHDAAKLEALYGAVPSASPSASASSSSSSPPPPPPRPPRRPPHRKPRPPAWAQRESLWQLLPDARMTLSRVYLSPGSVVGLDWILSGTDTRGLGGKPPSGKPVGVRALTIIWFDSRLNRYLGPDTTYFDMATLQGQASGAAKVRPPPALPTTTSWDWGGGDSPIQNNETDDQVDEAFSKNDPAALGALLTDDVVWSDLTAAQDVTGKAAVLAELAARRKAGSSIESARRTTVEVDVTWKTPRGELAEHAAYDWRNGQISAIVSFDRVPAP